MAIFVKFLKCTIVEDVTSEPDTTYVLVSPPVGNVLSPLSTFDIVTSNVMMRYVSKQMVINPPRERSNSIDVPRESL